MNQQPCAKEGTRTLYELMAGDTCIWALSVINIRHIDWRHWAPSLMAILMDVGRVGWVNKQIIHKIHLALGS
jgi:hypothetical protein